MEILTIILSFFFVSFTDKGGSDKIALSSEALALRAQRGIAIDSLDYAVCPAYLDSLRNKGARICHTSRWMNGATVYCHKPERDAISQLPFVKSIDFTSGLQEWLDDLNNEQKKRGRLYQPQDEEFPDYTKQLEVFNLLTLHEAGYKGQGVTIAVIDGGFWNLSTAASFDSIRTHEQLLGKLDFAEDDAEFEGSEGEHGAVCLGLIAGHTENYEGAATQAKFYAVKSEEFGMETRKEVDNLVASIEACDSLGVWIASISLGYSTLEETPLDYTYSDMNGKNVRSSQAATIAARKGMLVCVAAGNTGATQDWPWIASPADADSILTVGAVQYDSIPAPFSSIGPTYDGRMKPEVCAVGKQTCLISANTGSLYYGNGTSFATPLIAGLAACLWSALPDETNMEIRERIIRSCDHYTSPDNKTGYGIPDAWKAYSNKPEATEHLSSLSVTSRKIIRNGRLIIIRDGIAYDILGNKQ